MKSTEAHDDAAAAIKFVIRSIEEQAIRSATPLGEETKHLLLHLPKYPTQRDAPADSPPPPDPSFESLCRLTREAHGFDISINSRAEVVWSYAHAALRVEEHPYLQLLSAAGFENHGSSYTTASVSISAVLALALYLALTHYGVEGFAAPLISVIFFAIAVVISLRLFRDANKRDLVRRVEEARGKLPLNFKFQQKC